MLVCESVGMYIIHISCCYVSFYQPPVYKIAFSMVVKFASPVHAPLRSVD